MSAVTVAQSVGSRCILWQLLSAVTVDLYFGSRFIFLAVAQQGDSCSKLGVCFVLCKLLSAVTVVQGFGRLYFGFDSYNIRTILGSLSVR